MKFLPLWHLKRLCDKHGLDYTEIDKEISYTENRRHLVSLVSKNLEDLRADAESQYEEYIHHHFLTFYVACVRDGTTKSDQVGASVPSPHFSLREWVNL